jgi:activating signal cointegrator complex subunit 3
MPISDYETDLKSVLDQAVRILQAMVDVTADRGWLFTTLRIVHLMQMILQGLWYPNLNLDARYGDSSSLYQLPHITPEIVDALYAAGIETVAELAVMSANNVRNTLRDHLHRRQVDEVRLLILQTRVLTAARSWTCCTICP